MIKFWMLIIAVICALVLGMAFGIAADRKKPDHIVGVTYNGEPTSFSVTANGKNSYLMVTLPDGEVIEFRYVEPEK